MDRNADGTKRHEREQRAVQSVEVGGRLLLALAANPTALSLKDLAAAADLTPSRAHPYLVSFGKLRLVEQQPGGHYALGAAALQMGLTCLHQMDPIRVGNEVAERLARRTGHAVALSVWGNFGPTTVRMIEAARPLHVTMRAGSVMSILGTATGGAFAAAMPIERLQAAWPAMPGGEADPQAAPEALDPARHRAFVDQLRRDGVVSAIGRPIPGVNAFAAPAIDQEGLPQLVITVLDRQERIGAEAGGASALAVREAAREVSRRLGGATPA